MSYTRIPELPSGGKPIQPIDINADLLVLEQDITRKVSPYSFLSESIGQLDIQSSEIQGQETLVLTDTDIVTRQVSVDTFLDYINTHQNPMANTFYVSMSGVDANDYPERGRNEELPFRTIKYAAARIANEQAALNNGLVDVNDPNPSSRCRVGCFPDFRNQQRREFNRWVGWVGIRCIHCNFLGLHHDWRLGI